MPEASGLTVRQYERRSIAFDIEFVVADAHRGQVRFSATSAAAGQYVLRGQAADLSTGGMGLILPHFVPKMCEGTVRLYGLTPQGTTNDGSPIFDVIFEHRVKVRRIYMSSHKPLYAVGVSFVDQRPDLAQRIGELLHMVNLEQEQLEAKGGRSSA